MLSTNTIHSMNRLTIGTEIEFDEFRAAFERAVPGFNREQINSLLATSVDWDAVCAKTDQMAPWGFLIFHTIEVTPLMRLAGHDRPCVEYLMGNHTIAERMYRHDPLAMLYVPLRVLLYADDDGRAVFVLDQPSTVMASLGNPDIDAVGRELDDKVATLLRRLGVDVPAELI